MINPCDRAPFRRRVRAGTCQLLASSALILAPLPTWAGAQAPAGLNGTATGAPAALSANGSLVGADAVMRAELSKSVRPAWFNDDHRWSGAEPVDLRINRTRPELLMLDGSNGGQIVVFHRSWLQTVRRIGAAEEAPSVHDSTRPEGALAPGQKWKSRLVAEQPPVDWCSDTRGQIEGDFEVGKAQTYNLVVNGQPQSLDVLPVVERGQWTRCFSGKRYTRMLYAPALDTVVSLEFITYRTTGQPHEASFRLQVKEIVGAGPK